MSQITKNIRQAEDAIVLNIILQNHFDVYAYKDKDYKLKGDNARLKDIKKILEAHIVIKMQKLNLIDLSMLMQ